MIYNFEFKEFTRGYIDYENDLACKLLIVSFPSKGLLSYKGLTLINEPLLINKCDISELSYTPFDNAKGFDSFDFHIIDSNKLNPQKSNMATFSFNINAKVNLPPSVVGDRSVETDYNTPYVMTVADFTTSTIPVYQDPENDPAYKVKVLTLPSLGLLKVSNANVTVDQEILISDIALGKFTYHPSAANTSEHSTSFTFAVSDTISQQFTT